MWGAQVRNLADDVGIELADVVSGTRMGHP